MFPSLPGEEKPLHTDHHWSEGWGGDIVRELAEVPSGHDLLPLRLLYDGSCVIFHIPDIRKYNQESIYKKNLKKHSLHFFGSDMSSRSHNVYSFDPKLSEASSFLVLGLSYVSLRAL